MAYPGPWGVLGIGRMDRREEVGKTFSPCSPFGIREKVGSQAQQHLILHDLLKGSQWGWKVGRGYLLLATAQDRSFPPFLRGQVVGPQVESQQSLSGLQWSGLRCPLSQGSVRAGEAGLACKHLL